MVRGERRIQSGADTVSNTASRQPFRLGAFPGHANVMHESGTRLAATGTNRRQRRADRYECRMIDLFASRPNLVLFWVWPAERRLACLPANPIVWVTPGLGNAGRGSAISSRAQG